MARKRLKLIPTIEPLPTFTPTSPPSSALLNVVLEYADVETTIGDGRSVLRLSPRRMKDPVIRQLLGRETRRLRDISVIGDDEAGQMLQVCDDAAAPEPNDWTDEASELDGFELTEAALAYIQRYESRRRA